MKNILPILLVSFVSNLSADTCLSPLPEEMLKISSYMEGASENRCGSVVNGSLTKYFDVELKANAGFNSLSWASNKKLSSVYITNKNSVILNKDQKINIDRIESIQNRKFKFENDEFKIELTKSQNPESYYESNETIFNQQGFSLICKPKATHHVKNTVTNKDTGEQISLVCVDEKCSSLYFTYKEKEESLSSVVISKVLDSKNEFMQKLNEYHYNSKKAIPAFLDELSDAMDPDRPALFWVATLGTGPALSLTADAVLAPVRIVKNIKNRKSTNRIINLNKEKAVKNLKNKSFNDVIIKIENAFR